MPQRDRSNQDRGFEDEPRRDQRRRDMPVSDDDAFELPSWGSQSPRPSSREGSGRPERSPSSRTQREPTTRSGRSSREPIPTLGDAFRRSERRSDATPDARSPSSTRDPYDRLRGVASRPARPIDVDLDPEFDEPYERSFIDEEFEDRPAPARETSRRRSPAQQQERRPATPRTPATQQIGGLIAAAAPHTRLFAGIAGFALLSLILMIATLAGRMSSIPDWLPIHLNAEGQPDLWGSSSTLWRIPLMGGMLTLMSVGVAWYLWKRDPFAARFMFSSTVLVHALCWIALINLVW